MTKRRATGGVLAATRLLLVSFRGLPYLSPRVVPPALDPSSLCDRTGVIVARRYPYRVEVRAEIHLWQLIPHVGRGCAARYGVPESELPLVV